jgi:hypothetical protein
MQRRPSVVVHCDWSKRAEKRWMMGAVRQGIRWLLTKPERVEDTSRFLEGLWSRCEEPGLFVGFDFPIGLPVRYAKRTCLTNFRHALREFGHGDWADWYVVAEHASQISVHRPFYPMRPGGRSQSQLLNALNVQNKNDLLRRCEKKTRLRPAACMLFWTLGGNQVGKAAISGWEELIVPNLDEVGLWPFDGPLNDLLQRFSVVVAETYPGEVYHQLQFPNKSKWSKRRPDGRQSVAGHLLSWLETRPAVTDESLKAAIHQGFAKGRRAKTSSMRWSASWACWTSLRDVGKKAPLQHRR